MFENANVKAIVDEYKALLVKSREAAGAHSPSATDRVLREVLVSRAAWTSRGAGEVVRLAREYGVFVLRNALALAIALDVQDGRLGL